MPLSPFSLLVLAFTVQPLGETAFLKEAGFETLELAGQEIAGLVHKAEQSVGCDLGRGGGDAIGVRLVWPANSLER